MKSLPTFDFLQGAVGKRLTAAARELGCPELPDVLLTDEQIGFLQQNIAGLPENPGELQARVVKGVSNGHVVSAGYAPDGSSLFTVRFALAKNDCVLTLSFYQDEWNLHRIDAIQTRMRKLNRLLAGGLLGAAVTAVFAFFAIQAGSPDLVAQAKDQGYVLLTQEQYQQQVLAGGQAPAAAGDGQQTATGQEGQKASGEEVTFTLQEGMTTGDLTSFLKENGLIQDQAQFNQDLTSQGIDTLLQPKEYVFKKGMSEEELLAVLKG